MRWFLFLSLLPGPIAQAQQHPIDRACASCLAKAKTTPGFYGAPGELRACEAVALRQWNVTMAKLLVKVPSARASQAAWVRQRDKHVVSMKRDFKEGTDITSDDELPMTAFDEIRWYLLDATRHRVWILTKAAGGKPFKLSEE